MCLFICSCSYQDNREDYNFLENNSIRFIKSDASISFLINKDNTFYLLLLNGTTITDTDYLIKIDNAKYNINYTEEYLLKDTLVLQDIIFKINDKIEIILNNKTFCIYLDRLNKDNFLECDFIYLYGSLNLYSDHTLEAEYIIINPNILSNIIPINKNVLSFFKISPYYILLIILNIYSIHFKSYCLKVLFLAMV